MKNILHMKNNTTNARLYGDMGKIPLSVIMKKHVIGYWFDLKFSTILFNLLVKYYNQSNRQIKWFGFLKKKKKYV